MLMKKWLVVVLGVITLVVSSCASPTQSNNGPQSLANEGIKVIETKVDRVVDGDTIQVYLKGKKEHVRLIGVDTPETVKEDSPVEHYGPEASNYTKKALTGKMVYLEFDVGERDRFGRPLAYVWLEKPKSDSDGEVRAKMFNAQLLVQGYGRIITIPPNVKYVDNFKKYQTEARNNKRGLWGREVK